MTLGLSFVVGVATAGAQTSQATPLVLTDVNVVDVEQGEIHPGQRLVITGNRITAVGNVARVPMPAGARVVDAKGKYLISGLWDMHTHLSERADLSYRLLVANGVTGMRDASSNEPLANLRKMRQAILAGTRVGPPRQILSGPALDKTPLCSIAKSDPDSCAPDLPDSVFDLDAEEVYRGWSDFFARSCARKAGSRHVCVADVEAVRRAVDSLKAAGADMIKTYELSRPMYFAVAAEARKQGIPFGGHAYWATAVEASDSGAAILDHTASAGDLDAYCLRQADEESGIGPHPIPHMRYSPAASLDRCRELADRFRRNGTWWVPTFFYSANTSFVNAQHAPAIQQRLEVYMSRFWTDSASDSLSAVLSSVVADPLGALRLVREAGLPVLAGTDVEMLQEELPGFALHGELALYVAEGLTPLGALQSATLNPAKMLHATDSLGTVGTGKLADLVLLDGDPLANIANTAAIRGVVANGRYFDRADLDRLLAEVRAAPKPPTRAEYSEQLNNAP